MGRRGRHIAGVVPRSKQQEGCGCVTSQLGHTPGDREELSLFHFIYYASPAEEDNALEQKNCC